MEAVRLYVEGVHCANCLKKLDSLSGLTAGQQSPSFNMSTKTLNANLGPGISDLNFQKAVEKLGFEARILDPEDITSHLDIAADRALLFRLSLAGLAAGNIMLLAISVYAGATGSEAYFMNFLSLILACPAVFYSAWPIHRAAFSDLSRFRISVELPISAAIFAGFVLSVWSMRVGGEHIYFDSITVLIFLVLAGRFLLSRVQRRFLGLSKFQSLFKIGNVSRRSPSGEIDSVDIRNVMPNDRIVVPGGELIPVDGVLQSKFATLDASVLTGETKPYELVVNESVFLGQRNLGEDIEIQAQTMFSDSRMFKILSEVEKGIKEKPRSILLLDKVGQAFLLSVFGLALLCLAYFWSIDPNEGVKRALALVLVSCPCTFAFGSPLVFSLAMNRMAELGVLIKHPNIFEKLLGIKQVVLDKTGTLTDGQYDLRSFKNLSASQDELATIRAICEQSKHPVSRGLVRYLSGLGVPANSSENMSIEEVPTLGLRAKVSGHTYLVNRFGVTKDESPLLQLEMGDQIWPEALELVTDLKTQGLGVMLLSGDSQDRVREISNNLGVETKLAFSAQSPEMKAQYLESRPNSLMVGDGANDSLALTKADVGLAVQGSIGSALQASDAYLIKRDLRLISALIRMSKSVNKVLRRNLAIAVTYNLIAATLALTGFIHPLLAAILMPLSSLSQLVSGLGVLRGAAWK